MPNALTHRHAQPTSQITEFESKMDTRDELKSRAPTRPESGAPKPRATIPPTRPISAERPRKSLPWNSSPNSPPNQSFTSIQVDWTKSCPFCHGPALQGGRQDPSRRQDPQLHCRVGPRQETTRLSFPHHPEGTPGRPLPSHSEGTSPSHFLFTRRRAGAALVSGCCFFPRATLPKLFRATMDKTRLSQNSAPHRQMKPWLGLRSPCLATTPGATRAARDSLAHPSSGANGSGSEEGAGDHGDGGAAGHEDGEDENRRGEEARDDGCRSGAGEHADAVEWRALGAPKESPDQKQYVRTASPAPLKNRQEAQNATTPA